MSISAHVKGLQHIGIPTTDLKKTIEFYKGLGFEVASSSDNDDGTMRVAFLKLKDLVIETYKTTPNDRKAGNIDHVALDVDDIEATFEEVKKGGYRFEKEEISQLAFWDNGVRFFKIYGPNEEIIEFGQIL